VKELSVFVDESGDFGEYEHHCPFYIVTLVFHDQSKDIIENIDILNSRIRDLGLPNFTIHTAPLIRNEELYNNISLLDRKRTFNAMYNFVRTTDITYHTKDVKIVTTGAETIKSACQNTQAGAHRTGVPAFHKPKPNGSASCRVERPPTLIAAAKSLTRKSAPTFREL